MIFAEAEAYLLRTAGEQISPHRPYRLERMRAFLQALGDPQERYATIHVAGTSGKGSTAAMIAAALQASGKRTGLHAKPHLFSVTERARIGGVSISEDAFASTLAQMMPAIEAVTPEHGLPSYYETLLALAFVHFAQENVDIAVVEAGLGGRLDGTNVLNPRVCVITNVGLDHTEILGDTLVKIAADKAGIAKPGIPLVTATEDSAARAVIAERCAQVNAPFVNVAEHARERESDSPTRSFVVETAQARYELFLPLLGRFQRRNAMTAIVALEQLPEHMRPGASEVERGLAELSLPGRMEQVPGLENMLFDIAHNPDKARSLAEGLRENFAGRRFIFIVAVAEGKDAHGVLAPLLALGGSFVFTSFNTPWRSAVPPERLAQIARETGAQADVQPDIEQALQAARTRAQKGDLIVVTGSTHTVADVRKACMDYGANLSLS